MSEYRPEHRCEAKIVHKILQQGETDGLYSLDGRRISLPPGVQESLTIEEITVSCIRCQLSKTFNTQGMGFAAYNEGNRQAKAFLKQNCGKWQDRITKGYDRGEMPDGMLPR